jgi:ankyrin repeat protein
MTRQIGPHTRVESLKKEAKQWLKALHAGAADALARFKAALPKHDRNVTLRTVQQALAREHGLPGWGALTDAIDARERELRSVADEMLKHAIFQGDPAVAARLFKRHPQIAKLDLFTAVAAGDFPEVERRLAADPAAASRAGGPREWPPLLYLTYMRLPGSAAQSLDIARALLDHGADPNARWKDDWDNPFSALCGVIALGEGVKPPHERAAELAELLLERGADPYDTQVFYNTSIVSDDIYWLDVLWAHSERRGIADDWRRVVPGKSIGGKITLSPLDFMLSLAVTYNHPRRAEWLLAHGAQADGPNAYTRRLQRDEALMYGNEAIAKLLERHGAAALPLEGKTAFRVACRNLDRAEALRLAGLHPEFLRDPMMLHTAAREGRRDIVELLLELGMDADLADHSGMRALHQATSRGALDVMQLLIERGADVDRPTMHYGGPMGFAAHFGQRAAAQLLAARSRDVHNMVFLGLTDRLAALFAAEPALVNLPHFRTGMTPLFTLPPDEPAALAMAQFLLERGADPSARDQSGATPADAARKRGLEEVARLLGAPSG